MYPSSGATFSGVPAGNREGVQIILEPADDWKIQEIGFDGVERYIRPFAYTDHVAKLARQVEWSKVVGSVAQYDNPSLVEDEKPAENEELTELNKKLGKPEEREIPEAGPWHLVAKNLHESLQQLNILLDNMSIMRSTDYMKPLTVLDPASQESGPEQLAVMKATQWIWKRRALHEASAVLDKANTQRNRAAVHMGLSDDYVSHVQRSRFFDELKEMRDVWRVRKTADHIYGDLGYHIFGAKYEPGALFDITRRAIPSTVEGLNEKSVLEVSVPKDLTRRATLSVTIVKDDVTSETLYGSLDDARFEYMNIDPEAVKDIHWKHSLKWAQNTLICRDTFYELCSDAVKLRSRLSIVRDNVLLIALFEDYLLRVELKYHPFKEGELPMEGDVFLTRVLRNLIVSQECTRWLRPQMFVPLPITNLPEDLDCRGSKAYTQAEIEDRSVKPKLTLETLIDIAGHYKLVQMALKVIETYSLGIGDDVYLQHRWSGVGFTRSQLVITFITKDTDVLANKSYNFIIITHNNISVYTKENQKVDCNRDAKQLEYCLKHLACVHSLTSIVSIAKTAWQSRCQVMASNVNATNSRHMPSPTLVLVNSSANRVVMIILHIDALPEIKVAELIGRESESLNGVKWTALDFNKMSGSTICRKIDILMAFTKSDEGRKPPS
ncbi:unnamed protein product [Caenorhabditis auriculariae]|uniref:Mediator of RNA polymerase II transcription subunit 17 n=1 Tax=Caenorhabditis auriculariae TaxID=2777116 RepID=A0A8S1HBA8_9PELO|nr:unnamed protein product [Caenorhabditis auriculariae]